MGFGFFAGGLAQGLGAGASIGRQAVMDQAYLKLQQKNQVMMEQFRQSQEAHMSAQEDMARKTLAMHQQTADEMPYEKIMGVAPEETGAAISAMRAFRNGSPVPPTAVAPSSPLDVASFDRMDNAGETPTTTDLDAIKQAPFRAAGNYIRQKQAEDLARENAQTTRLGDQTDIARQQLAATLSLKEEMLRQRDPQARQVRDLEKKIAIDVASGKLRLAPGQTPATYAAGLLGIDGGGSGAPTLDFSKPGAGGATRTPSAKQIADMDAADQIVSTIGSVANAAKNPPPGPFGGKLESTGILSAPITKLESKLPNFLIPGETSDDVAKRAAYHGSLVQAQLQQLRNIFKSRISNFDLAFSQIMSPGADKNPEANRAILNKMYNLARNSSAIMRRTMEQNGYTSIDQIPMSGITVSPEQLLGDEGPATNYPVAVPEGTVNLPGQAPMQLGAPNQNGGQHPLHQAFPGGVKQLDFRPIYPSR